MTLEPSDAAAWHILGELLAAFGQGAGSLLVTGEAVEGAAAIYLDAIKERQATWAEIELSTVAFARSLGQLAAHYALGDRRDYVTGADLNQAITTIRPRMPCPMCIDPRLARR